jgi:tRNA pseudouridine55 synthase
MNGLLVLDKPAGMTSHDVVRLVRRATGEESVGHMGTLDPMATGVLPLLLGKYTRLAQFYGHAEKTYTGTIRFGFATDTYDAEGKAASETKPLKKSISELRAMAEEFLGESLQVPPVYSAKKIEGIPAYKLARAGKPVEMKPTRVVITEFDLLKQTGECVEFSMTISAGGYVRSVAHELGQKAECGAHLKSLRRTKAGAFTLQQAMTLETMQALASTGELEAQLPHPRTLLPEMPSVTVDEMTAVRIRNGMAVNLPEYSSTVLIKIFANERDLLAIGKRIAGTLIQPMVVLG